MYAFLRNVKTENNRFYCPFFYLFFGFCDFTTWLSMKSTFMTLHSDDNEN